MSSFILSQTDRCVNNYIHIDDHYYRSLPWLKKWWERKQAEKEGSDSDSSEPLERDPTKSFFGDDPDDNFQLTEDKMDDLMEAAQMKSDAKSASALHDLRDFEVVPRIPSGAKRTKTGLTTDGMRAKPLHQEGYEFCVAFLPQRTLTLGTVSKFNQHDADMVCRMWEHKVQFFFDFWKRADYRLDFTFTLEDISSYVPHPDFSEYTASVPLVGVVQSKIAVVDALEPSFKANRRSLLEYRSGVKKSGLL